MSEYSDSGSGDEGRTVADKPLRPNIAEAIRSQRLIRPGARGS